MSEGEMSEDESDYSSDSDGVPSTESVPEPNRVFLAKIFMSTPNPANSQRPLIAEWDGENPGHTKRLFVYAHIDNSTYESYVTLSSLSDKRLKYVNTLGDRQPFHRGYDKLMHIGVPFSNYFQSSIHDPGAYNHYPNYPELETLLRNLMSGTLSDDRDVLDRHRIYVFDPDRTLGIPSNRSFEVTPPNFTYWYKLNNLSGQDAVTEGPLGVETIREIPQDEFEFNYKIVSNFIPDNVHMAVLNREFGQFGKRPKGIGKTRYLPLHNPNRGRGNVHSHRRGLSHDPISRRGGKKRNKTRRKYRKIKSRRRRVIR